MALDTAVSPELAAEGIARDVVRVIQDKRKNQDLHVTDRITVTLIAGPEIIGAVEAHRAYVCEQVLAVSLDLEEPNVPEPVALAAGWPKIDAGSLAIHLAKAE